ncbi:MAG: response regulator, partial [Campylobacterota bacterium]|nr:response regulator [Campylobacterota bacterium]
HLLEKGLKSFFDYLEDSKKEIHEIPITSNDEFGKMNENINKSINISVHMYKELEDLTQNLEVKIDERTKELKKERKKALDATNAKSDFLAKMSHEIRTPMNAVLGMLYLTQKTNLNLMQDNYISKASSAAKSLLAIINDILDFSKIEAGKLSLENKDILFNDMIHETMDIMSFNAQEKGCELLAYYDNNIPAVIKSDKLRIQQILNNLISNAIKFTTHGEVVISSKLIKHQNNIATIKFCVKDSGIGINQEGQSKLFQDFSQVDDTITRKFGGTGLGLAISKKLSDMLGGEIWLEESTLNIGSIFCFTITAEISSHTIQKPSFFPMEMNDINTLIIDDNRIACDVLKDMLESFGFNVDVANNGQDGYDTIVNSDKNYDLLFLDYQMPKLNGIQTYKKIKTIQNKPIPKTIMITAYSENVVINEIKMLGIKSYLTKPVSPSTLYDTIIEVLNPHKEKNKILIDKNEFDTLSIEGIKILLVEDNELNQDFAVALLESADISVDIANDGVEALKLVKSKIYDTVLMDIQMPNMDGLTATKLIRDMQKDDIYFKDLPIIALSANTLAEDIEKSLNAGMNRHISKPINPEELFEALEQFAGHKYIEKPILNTQTNNQDDILNTDEALSRIGGNEMVYDKLLEKFIKKYKNVDKEIFKYIENKDLSTAQKKSHEVKGVAGNIGAIDLFNSLTLIDKLLKKGEVPTKEHFDKIAKSVNDTVDTITKYIQKEKSNQKELGKELDSIRAKKILTFIKNNVENDIMECENKIEELIPLFVDTKYLDKFELLREYFDEFDLDSAIDIVDQLLNDI